jgi:hypothetical protein
MNKQNVTLKKAMLEALEKSLGIVTTAAKSVGITRKTHYDWLNKDPQYAKAVTELEDLALDYVESKLFKNIEKEKEASVFFYMKTKGKKRGYVERQEIVHQGAMPVTKISEEAMQEIDKILDKEY